MNTTPTHRILFFALLTSLMLMIGCKKKSLPEPTTLGKGTFGMLLNDTIWEPFYPSPFSPGSRRPDVYFYKDLSLLEIIANNLTANQYFKMSIENVVEKGDYQISISSPMAKARYPDSLLVNYYYCADTTRFEIDYDCRSSYKLLDATKSKINLSYFDTIQKIVSGTFELELTNPNGDIITITSGVFDSHYLEQ